jgi:hypothetical protein
VTSLPAFSVLYAATDSGIYSSRNRGITWTALKGTLPAGTKPVALAVDAAGTLYAAGGDPDGKSDPRTFGVYRSPDGGITWNAMKISRDVTALTVDPALPGTIYAGTFGGGVFRRSDITGPESLGASVSGYPAAGNSQLFISATVDDLATGRARIAAAELFIDTVAGSGSGTAMAAKGGYFLSPAVTVGALIPSATVAALTPGSHTAWVRGQDSGGNWGEPAGKAFVIGWRDVTELLGATLSPPIYDTVRRSWYARVKIVNNGGHNLSGPLRVVVAKTATAPYGTDGVTPAGEQYLDLLTPQSTPLPRDGVIYKPIYFKAQPILQGLQLRIEQYGLVP